MDQFGTKGDFVQSEHFDNIPKWSIWECLNFLGYSETTQGNLKGPGAGPARAVAVARIEAMLSESSSDQCIKDSDYTVIFDTFSTMKSILDPVLVDAQLPTITPAGVPQEQTFSELESLCIYTERVLKFLQGPPANHWQL
jgi:hypothetical protein